MSFPRNAGSPRIPSASIARVGALVQVDRQLLPAMVRMDETARKILAKMRGEIAPGMPPAEDPRLAATVASWWPHGVVLDSPGSECGECLDTPAGCCPR